MNNNYLTSFGKPFFIVLLLIFFCQASGKAPVLSAKDIESAPPRIIRTCCSFGAGLQMGIIPFLKYTDITSVTEIGEHEYLGGKNEGNGNIYTRRGGFIDLGHLRDCADWTAYLYNLIDASREKPEYETDLGFEGGAKKLFLNPDCAPDSTEVVQLAGKIAYDLSLWHEIATWYGASVVPLLPERYSSFSPEDLYSNLLGIHLAIRAIQSDEEYNTAMTRLIAETLNSLGAVTTRQETYVAMEKVENSWWTDDKRLPSKKILLKRYLDSGDELLPWLLPDEKGNPLPLVKPAGELNDFYRLEIKLNYHFPVKKIFGKPGTDTITQHDFEILLQHISFDINRLDTKTAERITRKNQRRENRS